MNGIRNQGKFGSSSSPSYEYFTPTLFSLGSSSSS